VNTQEPFITFNPDAGPFAIVMLFLFGLFGLLCLFRPDLVTSALLRFFDRFGPPTEQRESARQGSSCGLRLFGAIFAFLGFYFFFGLLRAAR
jgi:hypothetical protein